MKRFIFIKMAFRFLGFGSSKQKSNARKSLLGAMFGIGISIIPLIIVLVVSDGMIKGITERTIELGTSHLQLINLRPQIYENECQLEKEFKDAFLLENKNSFLKNAWIERQGSGLVIGKNGRSGGTIRAIETSFFKENKKATNLIKVISGSLDFSDSKSVILGKKIANKLELSVGDSCRIITLYKKDSGRAIPKINLFKVSGIISSGYEELDALWVFIPLKTGVKILDLYSATTSILISTQDPFDEVKLQELRSQFQKALPSSFQAYTWFDLNRSSFVSFKTTKNILMFIMFLIALVASANISSAVVMLVMERRREIAILKATGASPSLISYSFLFAGFLTSLAGLVFGMPLGILASLHINSILKYIEKVLNYFNNFFYTVFMPDKQILKINLLDPSYYLQEIPISLNFKELYIIAISMLLLSVIVCIIPAIRAGREKPIDIMRKI